MVRYGAMLRLRLLRLRSAQAAQAARKPRKKNVARPVGVTLTVPSFCLDKSFNAVALQLPQLFALCIMRSVAWVARFFHFLVFEELCHV